VELVISLAVVRSRGQVVLEDVEENEVVSDIVYDVTELIGIIAIRIGLHAHLGATNRQEVVDRDVLAFLDDVP